MNLPNKLTILRIILVPVFVACFYLPVEGAMYIAAVVFVVAYFTDMLDGYIARKYNLITDFGKLMDPMADKLLTAAAMIMLTAYGLCSPIATFLTIGRRACHQRISPRFCYAGRCDCSGEDRET